MSETLISLRKVDVVMNGTTVLRGVTWDLPPGQHWLIRGANGSGKSTFLRLLRGEVWPAPQRGERVYRFAGGTQFTAVEVRRHIALVSPELQERYLQQEWRMTGRDVIHTGFAQTDMLYVPLTRQQKRRTETLAKELGLEPLLARDMQTLSTGELRKILIARAIVGAPEVLLLDEVCDGLDVKFRDGLLRMIAKIARCGTQIVYTTHRPDESLPVITHEAEFRGGKLGMLPLSLNRSAGLRPGSMEKNQHAGSETGAPLFDAEAPFTDAPARILSQGARKKAKTSQATAQSRKHAAGTPLIRIQNADVFLDRARVLQGVHWELRRGEHWAVLGGNGAGKTTFLKLIASDLYPAFGARVSRFEFKAEDTIWDLRRRVGCVSPLLQTHYREQLTAEAVVASGFFSSVGLMDRPTAAQLRRVCALFREFHLDHLRTKSMLALSFGELRKILTLRALVHEPELLIFDEPFDGLDLRAKQDFTAALERVAARGTQMIMVTHHLDDLPRCITHGLFLAAGRIVTADRWAVVRAHPEVVGLFGPP